MVVWMFGLKNLVESKLKINLFKLINNIKKKKKNFKRKK